MPWPHYPHVWVLTHRGGHHPQCAWVGMCGQQNAAWVPMSYFQTQSINDTATSALSLWIMCSGGTQPLRRGHSAWRRGFAGQGTAASVNSQHQPASHGGSTWKQEPLVPTEPSPDSSPGSIRTETLWDQSHHRSAKRLLCSRNPSHLTHRVRQSIAGTGSC